MRISWAGPDLSASTRAAPRRCGRPRVDPGGAVRSAGTPRSVFLGAGRSRGTSRKAQVCSPAAGSVNVDHGIALLRSTGSASMSAATVVAPERSRLVEHRPRSSIRSDLLDAGGGGGPVAWARRAWVDPAGLGWTLPAAGGRAAWRRCAWLVADG